MPKYCFAFGPNGEYYFNTELQIASQGIPEELREKIYITEVQASNRFVSLGNDGEYFYARQNGRFITWNSSHDRDSTAVSEWMNKQTGVLRQFSFGPDNTYIACTPNGAVQWSGSLPLHVKNAIKGFHAVTATLGVRGAYVLVDANGRIKWNLAGRYDQVDQILTNSSLAIEMVVLNPHAEKQYFIIFKNGTWRSFLPTSCSSTVKEMMEKQGEHDVQIMSMTCKAIEQNHQIAMNAIQNMAANAWNF